ncbi:histidine kinase [Sphingobacterium sp. SRCM116780]|uniref:tetratricopeptide repeat-containing sensor histidine kinase n=1 Tax=Sphingobacterium sp. SRCM116780 TaxID=2907623 RepID=UPI001F1717A1|nr:histidine kinase [Sphingobacterium sp. SRCM116780]UIR55641.1 histidine kinase [Sphingobacterium sp. SRCM116780]
MTSARLFLIIALSFIHFLAVSQSQYKALVNAAADSTQQNKYEAAIKLLLKAKALKGKDVAYSERINMHLGSNYEAINKIDSSIYYYGEAVKFCEREKDYAALSFLFSRLASIELSFTNRYTSAIRYFKKQLVYEQILKDSTSMFECLNNLGLSYKSANEYDNALLYFNKVTTNNSSHNHSKNNALLFTGDTYSLQKKYPIALAYYDKAIAVLTTAHDSTGLFTAFANKGDCLMRQNRFEESLICLKNAQQFITPYITNTHRAVLYSNFAHVYSKQRKFDQAFYFKDLENITKDSINMERIGNAIAEMSAKYELRQKQDSLFINKQKLVLADAKAAEKERNFIILLIAFIAIIFFFISIYRIRQLRFKNSLQQQQAAQNALQLTHQYQLSESELKAIRSQMNPHFIFNVLNSIESYIMDNEKRTASRLIQKFALLSRLILENSTKSLVKGDKEWKALMLYTELEAMRYDEAFTYTFTVADNIQLKTLYLPPMLIQPLIENAILHGLIINPKADAHVSVTLQKKEDRICITVEDNGVGIDNRSNKNTKDSIKEMSLGLVFINERIDMINRLQINDKASFTIKTRVDQKGTIATICLPIFRNPDSESKH